MSASPWARARAMLSHPSFRLAGKDMAGTSLGIGAWVQADGAMGLRAAVAPAAAEVENTRALGLLIYDKYILLFQLSGLILLVAMIGAILLTMRHRKDIKRQNVLHQMWRDPAKAMELKDVQPGQGL